MNTFYKNTKITATSGPSLTGPFNLIDDIEKLGLPAYSDVVSTFEQVFLNGVNCVRFNFSHSNTPERLFRLKVIADAQVRMAENAHKQLNTKKTSSLKFLRSVSNMCDTKGPEIRVFKMADSNGQKYTKDSVISIHCLQKIEGGAEHFSVFDSTGTYNMANDCCPGNSILVDDGKLSLKILEADKASGIVKVLVENTHVLKTNKRINLPGAAYTMPFLSDNDIADIKFAADHNFHLIALSFVNKAEDVLSVKKILQENNKDNKPLPALFSKIETLQSLKNIDSIIEASDGIMVARGDLGLEIPYFEVPYWTKVIIKKCAIKNIPVIVATQMLDSLERSIIPTRAEVTDVYRAVELGSDCTMLSGETAQGQFPLLAIETMAKIGIESELRANYCKFIKHFSQHPNFNSDTATVSSITALYNEILQDGGKHSLAVAAFADDITPEFLKAITAAKLPVSMTVFYKEHSSESALKNFDLCSQNLSRGIYQVAVINSDAGLTIADCFEDYINSYDYFPSIKASPSKIFVYANGVWVSKIIK